MQIIDLLKALIKRDLVPCKNTTDSAQSLTSPQPNSISEHHFQQMTMTMTQMTQNDTITQKITNSSFLLYEVLYETF